MLQQKPIFTVADVRRCRVPDGATRRVGAYVIIGRVWAWEVREGKLRWADVEQPVLGADDIVIRVTSAGVCGSDVAKLTKAVIPTPPGQPWRPGHEIVGWSTDSDGQDRLVAVNALVPCGECVRCRTGDINVCTGLRMVGWHLPGGFAPYVAVPRSSVVELPPGLDEAIAVLADPMAVAVHGIRCGLGEAAGRLAVIGGGALGTASAVYAASRGWETEILVRDPARLAAVADAFGAAVRPLASVRAGEFDAVVDAAGGTDDSPFLAALDAVRDGGRVVVQTAYYPGVGRVLSRLPGAAGICLVCDTLTAPRVPLDSVRAAAAVRPGR